MQKWINFLRGSVCAEVTGAFPERFLNLCAQEGIGFWALEWPDNTTLRLRVSLRDAGRLDGLAKRVMVRGQRADPLRNALLSGPVPPPVRPSAGACFVAVRRGRAVPVYSDCGRAGQ